MLRLAAARRAGANLVTGAEVTSITPDGEVRYRRRNSERVIGASVVLAGVAPYLLEQLVAAGSASRPASSLFSTISDRLWPSRS